MNNKDFRIDEVRTYGVEIEVFIKTSQFGVPAASRYDNTDILKVGREVASMLSDFGVPTSYAGYTHRTSRVWKLVTDSSIQNIPHGYIGMEFVSPPMVGEAGMSQLKEVCGFLDVIGAKVNKTCGVHDAGEYTLTEWKKLLKMYVKYEAKIDTFLPESRRSNNNRYTKSMLLVDNGSFENNYRETFKKFDKARTLTQLMDLYSTRYHKINMKAYLRHGTVEFRQHSGTIEFEKIKNWILFTQLMVNRATKEKGISPKIPGKQDYMDSLIYTLDAPTFLRNYLEGRARKLAV